ncbi:cysteine proteinase [Mucor ambiguus]|uniref:ubiquitinyl hydrolase 1 n=1 Tax=Mucor ambiguus TaxID=91626 RepID=A0A0C9MHH3_9FUNG|nr:cysteine proteinase [Mucor ambiguus]
MASNNEIANASNLQAAEELLPQFDELEIIGTYSFVWPVDNFTKLNKERVESLEFKTDDHCTWYFFDLSTMTEKSIGLFLENVDCKNSSSSKDVCAAVVIRIMNPQDPTKFFLKVFHNRFNQYEADWGYHDFMKWDILFDHEQPYVIDDKLVIECIIQLKKDPTGILWQNFKVYDSKKTTGYVGLYNQGATCYMNSLFQSLFFTNIFRKSVYQIPTENDNPQESVALALQRLFFNLQFSSFAVSTTEITQSFGWDSHESFMQHDVQEFSRLLQEHIERKMLNTPAEGTIKEIFVGKIKSYIKCINVDHESSRSEEFYDIQLNVKGCQDLKESFEEYIREEMLEKENKYMAEGHGLQDAKKGVIFEAFPPVLQIQLKRFDYDMHKDAMVKINDRHEFPAEIDLQPYYISREEQPQSQQNSSFRYILHGVLVHSGSLTSGHYFAFVRPTKEDQWFEFNDERVTPASLDEVFEANFGGQSTHEEAPNTKSEANAYMLVYIRDSSQDQVLAPVTINDIPRHLLERIENEKKTMEAIEKQRAEQHLYMKVYTVSDAGFLMNRGIDFIDALAQKEWCPYQETRLLRSMTVGDFLQQYTAADNRSINDTRVWIIGPQPRTAKKLLRPVHLVPKESYSSLKALQGLCRDQNYPFLRLYIEDYPIQEAPTDPEVILLFAKYYDPVTQTLRGAGKLYVSYDTSFRMIESILSAMVGLKRGVQLDMYQSQPSKENDIYELEELVQSYSMQDYNFMNGDIICFQRHLTHWQAEDLFRAGKCPDAPSYYQALLSEVNVHFMSRDSVYNKAYEVPFKLTLHSVMSIPQVIAKVARHLQQSPDYIQLLYATERVNPLLKGIDRGWDLRDALQMCPNYDLNYDESDLLYLKRMKWTLYYDVLPMSLADTRGKNIYRINVCNTLNQPQTKAFLLSKNALVSEMCHLISPRKKVRVFKVKDGLTVEIIGKRCTVGHWLKSDADNVYAEITPKEECNISREDFYITVYHYEKTLTQTHSIPFKFLIIKDEPFNQTKRRLHERAGLSDEQWSQVKLSMTSLSHILKTPEEGTYEEDQIYDSARPFEHVTHIPTLFLCVRQ